MLQNLNEKVCVSKYTGKDEDLWACYEHSYRHPKSKLPYKDRQMWTRLTGLMSASEMHRYLETHYRSLQLSESFSSIAA